MNGNGASSNTNINTISIPALTQHTNGSSHLAPGGAELNLLPSHSTTTNNGAIYRNQGKLIVKGSFEIFYHSLNKIHKFSFSVNQL
jgi:hypothetical protein